MSTTIQTIMVRRGDQVIKDVPARLLIPNIKSRKLRGSDEISADGKYLYFASDRPGGQGKSDIYVSTKKFLTFNNHP